MIILNKSTERKIEKKLSSSHNGGSWFIVPLVIGQQSCSKGGAKGTCVPGAKLMN